MTQLPHLLLAAVVQLPGSGYMIDGASWPGGIRARVTVKATAADGTTFSATWTSFPDAEPLDIRILLLDVFKQVGFVARHGSGETVWVYGPGGQGIKSLTFESDVWVPYHTRAPGLLNRPPKKAAKK
ncbi:MAG: hypothetical protein K2X87_20205 [Gemmataceae bacterium]|nr:hypothetical protein [Gemmataceae bacterium]